MQDKGADSCSVELNTCPGKSPMDRHLLKYSTSLQAMIMLSVGGNGAEI